MVSSSLWVLPVGAASSIREAARTRAAGEQAVGMTERSGREAAGVTGAGEGPTSGVAAIGSYGEDSWTCATPAHGPRRDEGRWQARRRRGSGCANQGWRGVRGYCCRVRVCPAHRVVLAATP
ncbi:MAG: hypothetical protein KGL63_13850 [Betaproteobacteria bacterium]|nr:hypothetical protein [Betaproteobacteria bacterium]